MTTRLQPFVFLFSFFGLLFVYLPLAAQETTLEVLGDAITVNHETGEALLDTKPYPTALVTSNTGKGVIDLWAYRFDPEKGQLIDSVLLIQKPQNYRISEAHLLPNQGMIIIGRAIGGGASAQWFTPLGKPSHEHQFSLGKGKIQRSWFVKGRGLLVAVQEAKVDSNGFMLHHVTTDGDKTWSKVFKTSGKLRAYDFAATEGGLLMLGTRRDSALLQHIDTTGSKVWSRTYGTPKRNSKMPLQYGAFHHFWTTSGQLEVIGAYKGLNPQLRISLDTAFNIIADSLLAGSYKDDYTGYSSLKRSASFSLIHHSREITMLDAIDPPTSFRPDWGPTDALLAEDSAYFITIATQTAANKDGNALLIATSTATRKPIWQRTLGRMTKFNDHYPVYAGLDGKGEAREIFLSRSFSTTAPDSLWLAGRESSTEPKKLLTTIASKRRKFPKALFTRNGLLITLIPASDTTGWLASYTKTGELQQKIEVNWRDSYQLKNSLFSIPGGDLVVASGLPRPALDLSKMAKEGKTFSDMLKTMLEIQIISLEQGSITRDSISYFSCGKMESLIGLPGGDLLIAGRCGKPYDNILLRYSPARRAASFVTSLEVPPGKRSKIVGIAEANGGKSVYALTVTVREDDIYLLHLHTLNLEGKSKHRMLVKEVDFYPFGCSLSSDGRSHALIAYTEASSPGNSEGEWTHIFLIKKGASFVDTATTFQVRNSQLFSYTSFPRGKKRWSLYGWMHNLRSKQEHAFLWTKKW